MVELLYQLSVFIRILFSNTFWRFVWFCNTIWRTRGSSLCKRFCVILFVLFEKTVLYSTVLCKGLLCRYIFMDLWVTFFESLCFFRTLQQDYVLDVRTSLWRTVMQILLTGPLCASTLLKDLYYYKIFRRTVLCLWMIVYCGDLVWRSIVVVVLRQDSRYYKMCTILCVTAM